MKTKKGFTLVELIIVISILAVLALILVPSIIGYTKKAKVKTYTLNAKSCYSTLVAQLEAEEIYGKDNSGITLADGVCRGTYSKTGSPTQSGEPVQDVDRISKNLTGAI